MKRVYEISSGELLRAVYDWLVATGQEKPGSPVNMKMSANVDPFKGDLTDIRVSIERSQR